MLAPHNVTSTLRMMSDQQLAQYARMHQNDPYIFPLAFQESQDRKNMRSEQMAKMSGQAQPPVVQQDLAQMMPQQAPQQMPQQAPQALPEEQGIGTLPAKNLQGMAAGGITGEHHFAKGGGEWDDDTQVPAMDMSPMGPTREYQGPGLGPEFNQYLARPTPYQYQPPQISMPDTKLNTSGISALSAANQAKQFFNPDVYQKQFNDYYKEAVADRDNVTKAREQMLLNRPQLGTKLEEILNKEESKAQGKVDDLKQMSLLEAGLGMLAGTSPYAFQNIAQGGKEGVKTYKEGMKDLQKAQDERNKAYAHIDDMRKAQMIGDQDKTMDYNERTHDSINKLKGHLLDAQSNLGINFGKMAEGIYGRSQTEAGANTRALLGAQMEVAKTNALLAKPPEQIQLATMLGGGDFQKGYQKILDATQEKSGVALAKLYENHITNAQKNGTEPMSAMDFANSMRDFVSSYQNPQQASQTGSKIVSFGQLPK